MPIDIPEPLPACVEVITSMRSEFKDWKTIGAYNNGGVEVYAYKLEDTGDGATYARLMYTPSLVDVAWGAKTGWRVIKEATCDRDGTVVYTLVLTTTVKEKV